MIYRIAVQNFENFREDLIEKVRDAVEPLCRWTYRAVPPVTALELVSESVTKTTLEWVADKLLGLGVQFSVEDQGGEFVHVATSAPARYDHGGAVELFVTKDHRDRDERHVAVPRSGLEAQLGRYSSGLFSYRVVK